MTAPRVARLDLADADADVDPDATGTGSPGAGPVDLGNLAAAGPAERATVAVFGDPTGAGSDAAPDRSGAGAGLAAAADRSGIANGSGTADGAGSANGAEGDSIGAAGPEAAAGSVSGDESSTGAASVGADEPGAAPVAALNDLDGDSAGAAAVADLGATGGAADGAPAAPRVARLGGGRGRRTGAPELIVQQGSGSARSRSLLDDQPAPRRRRSAERRSTPDAGGSNAGGPDASGPPDGSPAGGGAPRERVARPERARRPFGPKQVDPDADPVAAAREICLRLLTDRARTRKELAQALARRGVPDEAAETVLERFDEVGLIDDAAFAGQWVRARHRGRGLSRRAIAQELRLKGVDDETAGEALAEVDDGSEERRARELVDRKLRTMPADTPEQRTVAARKLVGMLARKGYGGGTAYGVVRQALADHGADTDELGDADVPD